MKQLVTSLAVAACLLCTLTGCSEELKDLLNGDNIENIFNGKNKDAISPVDMAAVLGEDVAKALEGPDNRTVISIFEKFNPDFYSHKLAQRVVLINDPALLENVYDIDGNPIDFSGIDFEKYTVVVGAEFTVDTSFSVEGVKAVVKGEKIELYTEVIQQGGGFLAPRFAMYFRIFPKLPDYDIEVIRWNNYDE